MAAKRGLTRAEIDERCGDGSPQEGCGSRDRWPRRACICTQWEADRRRGVPDDWARAAHHILKAAGIYGIRGLADEAMEVIAAELRMPCGRSRG